MDGSHTHRPIKNYCQSLAVVVTMSTEIPLALPALAVKYVVPLVLGDGLDAAGEMYVWYTFDEREGKSHDPIVDDPVARTPLERNEASDVYGSRKKNSRRFNPGMLCGMVPLLFAASIWITGLILRLRD
jgi:hypothetical protein